MAGLRDLVTPLQQASAGRHHEWKVLQWIPRLARSRHLVTRARSGACRGHSRDARRASAARARRAPGRESTRCSAVAPTKRPDWRPYSRHGIALLSRSVDARGCDGPNRISARNTNTCAVRTAPSPLLDRVAQSSPIGSAHALRRSLKKTTINPEEDASETLIGRRRTTKKMHVQTGRRRTDSNRR